MYIYVYVHVFTHVYVIIYMYIIHTHIHVSIGTYKMLKSISLPVITTIALWQLRHILHGYVDIL